MNRPKRKMPTAVSIRLGSKWNAIYRIDCRENDHNRRKKKTVKKQKSIWRKWNSIYWHIWYLHIELMLVRHVLCTQHTVYTGIDTAQIVRAKLGTAKSVIQYLNSKGMPFCWKSFYRKQYQILMQKHYIVMNGWWAAEESKLLYWKIVMNHEHRKQIDHLILLIRFTQNPRRFLF